ncbi:MAG: glycosyltransferase family 4 protein [Chlamydiae bacterium]|nr:glycosyltransferase family 4 protein [Chlamydiota bacterium]MBI3266523.1 glycosyltransferase family 4 protein [Chlamydiota bacterium]
MKLTFVVPRYDIARAGGAEILVQNLAERLASVGHDVEVLTTCSEDHVRWTNDFPAGKSTVKNVRVFRFEVDPRVNLGRFIQLQQRLERGWPLNSKEEVIWMAGSVHSKSLYDYLEKCKNERDAFIFAPYLFGMIYQGIQKVLEKSFLIPCLHPEPYAYVNLFKKMFQGVSGFFFNSFPEEELAKKIFGIQEKKCAIVGMGFDPFPSFKDHSFREKFKLGEGPFLLYVGRRENGKNTPLLIDYFLTYRRHSSGDLKLVLLGSGDLPEKARLSKDILDLGFVSEEEKIQAYREALVTCQPSLNESFSIVLMESWLAGTPVLVNEKCDVTSYHAKHSNGGLVFKNYFEFEEALQFFLKDSGLREKMGRSGRQYVINHFKWKDVLERFSTAFEKRIAR